MPPRVDSDANWEVQARKGVLELVTLLAIRRGETYGYELVTTITDALRMDFTEGTIYPLLGRLHSEGLLSARWVTSQGSVPRKYYSLTAHGQASLERMEESWARLAQGVARLSARAQRRANGSHDK